MFCESVEVYLDVLKGFVLVGLRGEGEEGWVYFFVLFFLDILLGFIFFIYCKLSFFYDEMLSDIALLRLVLKFIVK